MGRNDATAGCLFGLAFGDALAAPTEFLSVEMILHRWPPSGPNDLEGNPSRVTDDTQMTISVGEALIAARSRDGISPSELERALRKTFVEWLKSPDNNRAPGSTCLSACRALARGSNWIEATVAGSKGCGANMRVAPVGLLAIPESMRGAIAQFQAALTHGHPTALAASDLTAFAVAELAGNAAPESLVERLYEYAQSQRLVYHADWLGALWERSGAESPGEFIARGWDECLEVLDRLKQAAANPNHQADPCNYTGDGWVAEEALGTGLLCFLLFPSEPVKALQRAAVTRGDSDSIACLTGAFAGAYLGIEAWPKDWIERIEYKDRLATIVAGLQ